MAISKEASTPLVVVVGITGKQGGSVVQALKASDQEYRICGLTRNVTKPMVNISLTADNEEGAHGAFQGADIIFVSYIKHELSEGKMLVDAAKFVGVKLFIWSGLESFKEFSDGRYPGVTFFESKAAVSAYARRVGIPLAVVVAGFYMPNIFDRLEFGLKRGPDEVYSFSLPAAQGTLVPFIDVEADYGRYGLALGAYVRTGRSISFEDIISQAAEVTGKKIVYNQINREAYIEPAANKEIGNLLTNMFEAFEHVGCYGTEKQTSEDILDRALKSWVAFLKENPPKFPA
ncbi:NAD(P)-binding protein [Mycena maculata]|uniref:NAD(P)-binding protein n=1 Tax=Mycena maculata TaxID=230809 RepID=A0AAD7P2W1_9AGAR|nr:NAD(P)-binding protein [Mycena maculata]